LLNLSGGNASWFSLWNAVGEFGDELTAVGLYRTLNCGGSPLCSAGLFKSLPSGGRPFGFIFASLVTQVAVEDVHSGQRATRGSAIVVACRGGLRPIYLKQCLGIAPLLSIRS
jgi:hypothetical protein